ncbi:MAG: DUF4870 domain-containing protein [Candidatus Magasanikbacteria bacterium]
MENQQNPPVQPPQPSQSEQPSQPLQPINSNPLTSSGHGDVEENKLIAAIAYLGILALVPLLLKKESPFAQFHGKQGLVLCIAWFAVSIAMIVPVIGWLVGFFGSIACFILMIVGILNTTQGKTKELPWIGGYGKNLNL